MVVVLGSNRPIEPGLLVEQLRQIVATNHPPNIPDNGPGRNIDKIGSFRTGRATRSSARPSVGELVIVTRHSESSAAWADITSRSGHRVSQSWGVIVIQRVRVRWSATKRGAPQADARRGLYRPVTLPESLPTCDVVVHEVLADEAVGYARRDEVLVCGVGPIHDVGLWLTLDGSVVTVERLHGRAAYPRPHASTHLFTLSPGQVGRYRANFRFTGCTCNPSWFYEDWLVQVSNGLVGRDGFIRGEPDRDVDDRVHLYGGAGHRSVHRRRRVERG